ncbi:IclR family transcriptional regulator [Paenibacillus senegalensis]|uniref:IclR family transcriptional regulator n=1 Tax=Paenibacillus senegalensis TaxID=1465766 RepID=UPI0002897A59|nr:IclR family transcriptional regulator [Paenibacillus senegalensis]
MDKSTKGTIKYNVPALEKAISILELLTDKKTGLAISDICQALSLPKTTVFTILNTLEAHNLVQKLPSGAFKLGLGLFRLGMNAYHLVDFKEICVPYMEHLRETTSFSTHLGLYSQGEMIIVDKLEGPGMIRFNTYIGERKQLNTSAVGKAICAYLDEEELALVIDKGLKCLTPNSICTEQSFRDHLKLVRKFGYAVDDEEGEIGIRCVATPIFNHEGKVHGGISVSTIKNNLSTQKIPEIGQLLMEACAGISSQLGYIGPYPVQPIAAK